MQPLRCAPFFTLPSLRGRFAFSGLNAGWLAGLALCALVLISGCSSEQASSAGGPGGRPAAGGPGRPGGGPGGFGPGGMPQSVGVVTAEATLGDLGLEIEAIGNAVANESTEITSKTVNTVTAIRFTEGQNVKKGMVLVEFDGTQARAELAAAEAAVAESRSQYKRSRELFTTQALSQSQLDQLEATLKTNESRVVGAQAKVEDTIIRAPFSGRMGFRRISLGSLVSPGTVIATLDDTSVMKLDFSVPQAYMFALTPGLTIAAQIAGIPNQTFTGKVTTLDSRVDPVSRSIVVRAELPNQKGVLKPGMFMTARITAAATNAVLIPEAAIVPEQGKSFVFVVKDGIASKREVSLGRRKPGQVQIIMGLKDGERVIVEGTQKVRDGIQVVEVDSDVPTVAAAT
jgi:membrane fusion protein, multidrug efflux system